MHPLVWEGAWSRGLIVSCQPVVGGPLDRDDFVLAMAQAAAAAGACAVRIEGVQRVTLVARDLAIPVVGIVKRSSPHTAVCITPQIEDVQALAAAGAAVVAFDATQRTRPSTVPALAEAGARLRRACHGGLRHPRPTDCRPGRRVASWWVLR
jgi:N-acylglucosamine-6-phosphate 2-epimerase